MISYNEAKKISTEYKKSIEDKLPDEINLIYEKIDSLIRKRAEIGERKLRLTYIDINKEFRIHDKEIWAEIAIRLRSLEYNVQRLIDGLIIEW